MVGLGVHMVVSVVNCLKGGGITCFSNCETKQLLNDCILMFCVNYFCKVKSKAVFTLHKSQRCMTRGKCFIKVVIQILKADTKQIIQLTYESTYTSVVFLRTTQRFGQQ